MNPRTYAKISLVAAIIALIPTTVGHAHGEPIIVVSPAVAAAGASITVTGAEMELGEVFRLFLESASTSIELGETAVADLTVTAASAEADPGPAMAQEPSGEPHLLDRSKPAGEIAGAASLALASAVLGVWLIRRRDPGA